ncbi:MAG: hypothetical protein SPF56_03650 [Bacteroidaceae bacterium]|nr:hypothetical protein [Prevotellaceae bacterium]MDY5631579.1 hypothetical protein [Bacteroidaceae bacterium]
MRYQKDLQRHNRRMMWMNISLGVLVIIIALGFLYLAGGLK